MTSAPVVLLRVDRSASHHTKHPRHLHPALDLKYLQAALECRLGETIPLLDGWLSPFDAHEFAAKALAHRPRIAVIRAVSWCMDESVAVGRALRASGVITVAVGQQVRHMERTGFPLWDEAYDLSLAGEPEEALGPLLTTLLDNCAQGKSRAAAIDAIRTTIALDGPAMVRGPDQLHTPRHTVRELEDYPFPFPLPGLPARTRWGYMLTSWGCPRPCRHCTELVRRSVGRPLRLRNINAVADEIAALRDLGAEVLLFEDDSILVHKSRFMQLADTIVRRGLQLPWLANARPDEIDAERMDAAKAAGAVLFKVGVDSGSPRIIEALGKSQDGDEWISATEQAFQILNTRRIGSVALFMVGLPNECTEDAALSLKLAQRIHPSYLQVQSFRAYPDIDLFAELPEALRRSSAVSDYHYLASPANCSRLPDAQLARLPGSFYRQFYFRPSYVARHLRNSWRHYFSLGGVRGLARTFRFMLTA